jgi:dynein heavy chain
LNLCLTRVTCCMVQVMLFSEGFANAKTLSRKMVKLYKLSSEQLSQQDHYVSTRARARASALLLLPSLQVIARLESVQFVS